jgi:hypothetical protein
MSDIVERLKAAAYGPDDLLNKAVAELTALRAEVERLTIAERRQYSSGVSLQGQVARLTAENAKLREALENLLRLVENEDGEADDAPPYLVDRVLDEARAALPPAQEKTDV